MDCNDTNINSILNQNLLSREYRDIFDKPRIVVAMSGGVDSSVAAVLMKNQGYEVIGVTLQLYDYSKVVPGNGTCCAGQDVYDAKMVAEKYNIPHYTLNYENQFREEVIDDFVSSYVAGETPIPCIRCNQTVKFRDLYKFAQNLNAAALVTGHYVQKIYNINNESEENYVGEMHAAIDNKKDQSYFLFTTTQEQLKFLEFPLGRFSKNYTRELAKKFGLNVANKKDSQGICFVGGEDYSNVIRKKAPHALSIGNIIHIESKEILGTHEGVIHYTIGQRKGLGVAHSEPLYVVQLDVRNNIVYVGEKEFLATTEISLRDCNWLLSLKALKKLDMSNIFAKVRSTSPHIPVEIKFENIENEANNNLQVLLHYPQYGISAGQACVIYQNERVIGGGWIL